MLARACLLLVTVTLGSCARDAVGCEGSGRVAFEPAPVRLTVQIADDPAARSRGLMGVRELPPDHGMAFVWGAPTVSGFWMKDTLIPLSLAFVDARGTIVQIEEMSPCSSEPCPTWEADQEYAWAIEANAGWFDANGVGVGDRARLSPGACP